MRHVLLFFIITVCLSSPTLAQLLRPNADIEYAYERTIALLNQGDITVAQAHARFRQLMSDWKAPSGAIRRQYGSEIWKLSVQAESAFLHRLAEAAIAALLEDELGRDAAASAWAQQLKYAEIHKAAKDRLNNALR